MQCLSKERVPQRITPGQIRWFDKEVFQVRGPEPLAVVRKRAVDSEVRAPVLLVHGFGQNRYAWHLPERSFANHLANQGFDVFNLELRGHGRSASFGARHSGGVDDYILEDIPAAIDRVLTLSGFPRVFVVGHSLGGLCAAAAGALDLERIAGVVALGAPHALGRGHLILSSLLKVLGKSVGHRGLFGGSERRFPLDWLGKAAAKTSFAWDFHLAPIPVRGWKPGSFSSDELKSWMRSFDGASLGTLSDLCELAATGELSSRVEARGCARERRLDGVSYTQLIEDSEQPLLTVCGNEDLLANPEAVLPMYENSKSMDKRLVHVDAGHGDLLLGRRAPELVWEPVSEWLSARASYASPQKTQRAPLLSLVRDQGDVRWAG